MGWTLTIRRLPSAGFEGKRCLIGVGWTLTIRQLPWAGFEGDGTRYKR
jgi:nitrogen fixation protein